MNNPYEILGVPTTATEQELKDAYRTLAKKYHPDNYADSPLSDLAAEKMSEVNAAYDQVLLNLKNNNQNSNNAYQQNQGGYNRNSSNFVDVRQLIKQNRLVEAEELLNGTPLKARDAEWYFLKGMIFYNRGWFDDAYTNFNSAHNLDPTNAEYKAGFDELNRKRSMNYGQQYNTNQRQQQYGNGRQNNVGGCSCCDACSGLICADCCCECMGGDLISCC